MDSSKEIFRCKVHGLVSKRMYLGRVISGMCGYVGVQSGGGKSRCCAPDGFECEHKCKVDDNSQTQQANEVE